MAYKSPIHVTMEPTFASTQYAAPYSSRYLSSINEYSSRVISGDTTVSGLYIWVQNAPGAGTSRTVTIYKNGSPTSITATISGTATSASDSVNTASFVAGDTISFQSTVSGSAAAAGSFKAVALQDGSGQTLFGGSASTTSASLYYSLQGADTRHDNITENRVQFVMPAAGTISNLYARVSNTPGAGKSWTFTLRKNGSNQSLTATISDSNKTANDTTNSFSVAAGDLISVHILATGTPTSTFPTFSVLFTPTTSGHAIIGGGWDDALNATTTEYNGLHSAANWASSESELGHLRFMGPFNATALYARLAVAAGASKSYDVTLRKNSVDTELSVNLGNVTTVSSDTGSVSFTNTDKFSFKVAPNSTPTVSYLNVGVLLEYSDAVSVTVQDATHSHTADQPAITQTHTIVTADATHGHTADNVTATVDSGHTLSTDSFSISFGAGTDSVTPNDADHTHTADSPAITQTHLVFTDAATHSHTADNVTISQTHVVGTSDATHTHTADSPTITQTHSISVDSATHAHTADNATLYVDDGIRDITVDSATHGHTADSVVFVYTIDSTTDSVTYVTDGENATTYTPDTTTDAVSYVTDSVAATTYVVDDSIDNISYT